MTEPMRATPVVLIHLEDPPGTGLAACCRRPFEVDTAASYRQVPRQACPGCISAAIARGRGLEFQTERPDDETLNIYLVVTGGQPVQIAHATHDEHGWSGIDLAESMIMKIAQAVGVRVEEAT